MLPKFSNGSSRGIQLEPTVLFISSRISPLNGLIFLSFGCLSAAEYSGHPGSIAGLGHRIPDGPRQQILEQYHLVPQSTRCAGPLCLSIVPGSF